MPRHNKATIERLRVLDILQRSQEVPRTLKGRDAQIRAAMAGEQVLRPIELFIYLGGNPDKFGAKELAECVSILRRFGYKPDKAVVQFGENLERVFIRTETWPEDEYWDEQVKEARKAAMAQIGLLDILEDDDED